VPPNQPQTILAQQALNRLTDSSDSPTPRTDTKVGRVGVSSAREIDDEVSDSRSPLFVFGSDGKIS
jgi:hypothetical protein